MIKFLVLCLFITSSVQAYVPSVESLFRNGSNPDVTANGVAFNLAVKKIQPGMEEADLKASRADQAAGEFYKFYFTTTSGETLKISQARYRDAGYADSSLVHKTYYPNFSPYTLKANVENMEKGVFLGLLYSLTFNNGAHLVSYLKNLGVPVKLNSEIINREKIEYLASYKRYLATINQNRGARKTEVNPLRPEDASARERVESVMNESMYVDTKNVKLGRNDGSMSWVVNAGPFEAIVSYRERQVQKILFKSAAGELEILCRDYWLANGTHYLPKTIQIRDFSGELYQVELTNLRHFNEREDELVKRLNRWDQILKGKEAKDPRPVFLL